MIANILPLFHVANKLHVQYNSRVNDIFFVRKDNGSARRFTPGPRGLYYCDAQKVDGTILDNTDSSPDYISTVNTNLEK